MSLGNLDAISSSSIYQLCTGAQSLLQLCALVYHSPLSHVHLPILGVRSSRPGMHMARRGLSRYYLMHLTDVSAGMS